MNNCKILEHCDEYQYLSFINYVDTYHLVFARVLLDFLSSIWVLVVFMLCKPKICEKV